MAELFAERYEIVREVGRGGFGIVYLALDSRLRGRQVALKVLHPALSTDPAVVRLFQEEAGILASLTHDHIIPVYDAGVWEGRRYIVMQFMEGRSLAQVVKDESAQGPERARGWLHQAASALAYAHEQGVLHRDVKSANLLLNRSGNRLYMTDFGLAHAVQASGGSSSAQTGTLTGTAAYRAPEVAKTGHTVASDLYSLGVVAYELLAGRLPFLADDPLSMMMLHATEPVPPLPDDLPADLGALVMRLLAKDPAARPASAAELLPVLAAGAGSIQTNIQPVIASAVAPATATVAAEAAVVQQPPEVAAPRSAVAGSQQRGSRRWMPWAIGAIAVMTLVLAVWRPWTPGPHPTPAPTSAPVAAAETTSVPRPSETLEPTSMPASTTAPAAAAPEPTKIPATATTAPALAPATATRRPTSTISAPTTVPALPTIAPSTVRPSPIAVVPTKPAASPSASRAAPGLLPAPVLQNPPDGASFDDKTTVILSWSAVKTKLAADEVYVITIPFRHQGATWIDYAVTADTRWVANEHLYLIDNADNGEFSWSVQLIRQTGTRSDGVPEGVPVSAASASRRFTWRRSESSGGGPAEPTMAPPY